MPRCSTTQNAAIYLMSNRNSGYQITRQKRLPHRLNLRQEVELLF